MIAPSLDILGGQSIQARRLLDEFAKSTRVEVAFLPVNPRLWRRLGSLQRVKYVRTIVTSVSYVASLLWRVPRCDLVHAFSASYYSYLLAPLPALVIAKLMGRKTLLNYRSGEAPDHLASWPLSRRSIALLADRVVVPSPYLVDVFRHYNIEAEAISNFVPLQSLRYSARPKCAPRLLSNRNLEPLYNVACILRAFALVQRSYSGAELVVVGDGSLRGELEAMTSRLGLRNVHFRGRVSSERMAQLYTDSDIFVNAPNIDNMPSSIIEAFACGLPVVTTNAGGIPYIVEHERTGLMVERNDAPALAAAVTRLLADPALALRLATAARAECESRYAWQHVRDLWESLYERLAGKTGK
ncbi:MAG: glycosyltransferase family 4 protein [Gammaproteobacteria bacterium]